MASIESILADEIQSGSDPLWPKVWHQVVCEELADAALSRIDLDQGQLQPTWVQLDDPVQRAGMVGQDQAKTIGRCITLLLAMDDARARPTRRAQFNAAIRTGGHGEQSNASLKRKLETVLPDLINSPEASAAIVASQFPTTWPLLADRIAQEIFRFAPSPLSANEWWILNRLMIAAYFRACLLPEARNVEQFFGEWSRKPLAARGALVRIVETVAAHGIVDDPPPVSTRTGGVGVGTAPLSDILQMVHTESAKIVAGNGVMHRLIAVNSPVAPGAAALRGRTTDAQLAAGRDASFRLYEYTLLVYMALAAIEQLLRSWAERCVPKVPHIKNGKPDGVKNWYKRLPLSPALRNEVALLFDSKSANIRNKVMHGALLDIDPKRLEVHLPIADPSRYPPPATRDAYSPENVAQMCLSCLERLDQEAITAGVSATDLGWTAGVTLAPTDIAFGRDLPCDVLGPQALEWQEYIRNYLRAMFPCLKQLFTIGFVGWTDQASPDSPVRFMGQGLVFEALYRLTVHLCGAAKTLQSAPKGSDGFHFQYRMLDDRANGICTDQVLDALLDDLAAFERPTAKRTLQLAFKARNALAHGAVVRFTQDVVEGMGHLFLKSVQCLANAGIHHMIREGAYYRYRFERGEADGLALEDWLSSEKKVLRMIQLMAAQ